MGGRVALAARLAALAALLLAAPGCDVNEYCLQCAFGDGGLVADAGPSSGDALFSDGGPVGDGCVSSGFEQCDGMDNDCDGTIDEDVPEVGEACGTDEGECVSGTRECAGGELVCGGGAVAAAPESCNNLDDDCDGTIDNGNPGGGTVCGTNMGECVSGLTMCVDGAVECVGDSGGDPDETCNGLDDDCDGLFDEGNPGGGATCGTSDTGQCSLGTEECVGGQVQCVGAAGPQVEQCDGMDHDCDGDALNGFDLQNDVRNCGTCGHDCNDDPAPAGESAIVQCSSGSCAIATCHTDYWDLNDSYSDGCEYGPCVFQGSSEACNQEDDDCDGTVDENLSPPAICDQDGACDGTVATCSSTGWECVYGADVETDADGAIVPETRCDGIDNDCDGSTDESFPLLGDACDDGEDGICRGTGAYVCNGDGDGVECNITDPGTSPDVEVCNNLDDDCNGTVDDDIANLSDWVDLGGVEIMAYEASRPDADATTAGITEGNGPCSKPDALPWTGIAQPDAEAACQAIGARLCSEADWEMACKKVQSPQPQDGGPQGLVAIQAEDYDDQFVPSASENTWSPDSTAGFTGTGALRALPDDGDNNNDPADYMNDSPRLDYDIDFVHTGTHYVWVRAYHTDGSDDSIHAGLDGAEVTTADRISDGAHNQWVWMNATMDGAPATIDIGATGVSTLNLWMRETGLRIDKIVLTVDPAFTPTGNGPAGTGSCGWSYESSCDLYQPNVCNGNDYDTDPNTAGDQDDVLPTGELAACYADWGPAGEVHDLSGNVKEWTEERSEGVNPIRGGASNNTSTGISCGFDFAVADDDFSFPNVGFRCCR